TSANDVAAWGVKVHFTASGGGGIVDEAVVARRNYLVTGKDPGSGHFHSWTQFERNVIEAFNDVRIQQLLANGLGSINQGISRDNPNATLPILLMRESPDGLPGPPQTVAGPLWVGGSVDGYIGPGIWKPSRTSRPISGSRVVFSSTNTTSTDNG